MSHANQARHLTGEWSTKALVGRVLGIVAVTLATLGFIAGVIVRLNRL